MDTFNADNTTCPWDQTAFQPGEEGMKCSRCGTVMKLASWQEYQYCRACQGRNAVRVRGVSSSSGTSPRRIGSTLNNPSPPIPKQQTSLQLIVNLVLLMGISFIVPSICYTGLNSTTYFSETMKKMWSSSVYDGLNHMMNNLWNWNPIGH